VKKVLIKIEYKGTNYSGWQVQPNAITVQQVLQDIFQQITQTKIVLNASSRTDAGVHAKGQVATLVVPERVSLGKLHFSCNSMLPSDISVIDMVEVPESFNVRKSAIVKQYVYQVLNSPIPRVFESEMTLLKKSYLDISKVERSITSLLGTHDFSAFKGKGCQQPDPTKTIRHVNVSSFNFEGYSKIQFTFEGTGFLKNMVRIIVGTLLDIAQGKIGENSISKALESKDRNDAGITIPPQGLTLEHVYLEPDPFRTRLMQTWQSSRQGC